MNACAFSISHTIRASQFLIRVGLVALAGMGVVGAQILTGRVAGTPITEQSAIVSSASYPDTYWVLNDSGDDARLFAIYENGEMILPPFLKKYYDDSTLVFQGFPVFGATNQDWETIARLKDTLVIGDTGNNGNARRDQALYFVLEPNPLAVEGTHILSRVPIAYPDQKAWPPDEWDFDCEAIFTFKGKVYFLTKQRAAQTINRPKPATRLYRLDSRFTTRINTLTLVGGQDNLGGWVTGADVSPDESRLAVLVHHPLNSGIWIFDAPQRGDNFLGKSGQFFPLGKRGQCEGICWKTNNTLIFTNEDQDIFEIQLTK